MIDNLSLFDLCLNNNEPIIDAFYIKHGNLIIGQDPDEKTIQMQNNLDLIESISTYSFGKKNKNEVIMDQSIEKIFDIVKNKDINFSEFVSFRPIVDISYSVFKKIETDNEKKIILKKITEEYIKSRHTIYSNYGYSPTTLQVGKDAKAHKESGNLGVKKVSNLLNQFGFIESNKDNIEDFVNNGDKKYVESDKKGKKLFKSLLLYYNIKFLRSSGKEEKMPDMLFRFKNDIFIVEHKHMKEGGGGQDKQINEIISFIGFSEKYLNIHYVSFLDGIYFNLFSNKKYLDKGKIFNQLRNIRKNLQDNKQNYFVNTFGFTKLLQNL